VRPHEGTQRRQRALAQLASRVLEDPAEVAALGADLQCTAEPGPVPIPFCRIDAERTCGLFYNPDTRRFYARLFLCAPSSRLARRFAPAGRYVDLRTGALYMRSADARHWQGIHGFGPSKTSILAPLECGAWHTQFLRFTSVALLPQHMPAWLRGISPTPPAAIPVTAWLVKRRDEYYLHVQFQVPIPPREETRTVLGIDRGITTLAAGAVLSADTRQVLETFLLEGAPLRQAQRAAEQAVARGQRRGQLVRGRQRRQHAIQTIHRAANQIVGLAQRYQAQVVMEDLQNFVRATERATTRPRPYRAVLSRRQYQRLLAFVDAKLPLVGLPPVRLVAPAYTSLTCSVCGHISRANRSTGEPTRFRCVACGHEAHADVQAAINVARKLRWQDQRRQTPQGAPTENATAGRMTWAEYIATFLTPAPPLPSIGDVCPSTYGDYQANHPGCTSS
jgi:IS605 OrfB family transposase